MNSSPLAVADTLLRHWQGRLAAFIVASVALSSVLASTGAIGSIQKPGSGVAAAHVYGQTATPAGPRGPIELSCAPGKAGVIGADGPAGPQGPVGVSCASSRTG
jgi:hypothetical protein